MPETASPNGDACSYYVKLGAGCLGRLSQSSAECIPNPRNCRGCQRELSELGFDSYPLDSIWSYWHRTILHRACSFGVVGGPTRKAPRARSNTENGCWYNWHSTCEGSCRWTAGPRGGLAARKRCGHQRKGISGQHHSRFSAGKLKYILISNISLFMASLNFVNCHNGFGP